MNAANAKERALRGIAKHSNYLSICRKYWKIDGRSAAEQVYLMGVGTTKFMLKVLASDYREACGQQR